MAMGNYDLGTEDVNRLKWWVREGGTLIAWKSAARWLIGQELIDERLKASPPDTTDLSYEQVPATRGAQRIGGAIFAAELDTTHPLAFGYGDRTPLFRNHEIFFQPFRHAGRHGGPVHVVAAAERLRLAEAPRRTGRHGRR